MIRSNNAKCTPVKQGMEYHIRALTGHTRKQDSAVKRFGILKNEVVNFPNEIFLKPSPVKIRDYLPFPGQIFNWQVVLRLYLPYPQNHFKALVKKPRDLCIYLVDLFSEGFQLIH